MLVFRGKNIVVFSWFSDIPASPFTPSFCLVFPVCSTKSCLSFLSAYWLAKIFTSGPFKDPFAIILLSSSTDTQSSSSSPEKLSVSTKKKKITLQWMSMR